MVDENNSEPVDFLVKLKRFIAACERSGDTSRIDDLPFLAGQVSRENSVDSLVDSTSAEDDDSVSSEDSDQAQKGEKTNAEKIDTPNNDDNQRGSSSKNAPPVGSINIDVLKKDWAALTKNKQKKIKNKFANDASQQPFLRRLIALEPEALERLPAGLNRLCLAWGDDSFENTSRDTSKLLGANKKPLSVKNKVSAELQALDFDQIYFKQLQTLLIGKENRLANKVNYILPAIARGKRPSISFPEARALFNDVGAMIENVDRLGASKGNVKNIASDAKMACAKLAGAIVSDVFPTMAMQRPHSSDKKVQEKKEKEYRIKDIDSIFSAFGAELGEHLKTLYEKQESLPDAHDGFSKLLDKWGESEDVDIGFCEECFDQRINLNRDITSDNFDAGDQDPLLNQESKDEKIKNKKGKNKDQNIKLLFQPLREMVNEYDMFLSRAHCSKLVKETGPDLDKIKTKLDALPEKLDQIFRRQLDFVSKHYPEAEYPGNHHLLKMIQRQLAREFEAKRQKQLGYFKNNETKNILRGELARVDAFNQLQSVVKTKTKKEGVDLSKVYKVNNEKSVFNIKHVPKVKPEGAIVNDADAARKQTLSLPDVLERYNNAIALLEGFSEKVLDKKTQQILHAGLQVVTQNFDVIASRQAKERIARQARTLDGYIECKESFADFLSVDVPSNIELAKKLFKEEGVKKRIKEYFSGSEEDKSAQWNALFKASDDPSKAGVINTILDEVRREADTLVVAQRDVITAVNVDKLIPSIDRIKPAVDASNEFDLFDDYGAFPSALTKENFSEMTAKLKRPQFAQDFVKALDAVNDVDDLDSRFSAVSSELRHYDLLLERLGLDVKYSSILDEVNSVASEDARKKAGSNLGVIARHLKKSGEALPKRLGNILEDAMKNKEAIKAKFANVFNSEDLEDRYQDYLVLLSAMNRHCQVYCEDVIESQQAFVDRTDPGKAKELFDRMSKNDDALKRLDLRPKTSGLFLLDDSLEEEAAEFEYTEPGLGDEPELYGDSRLINEEYEAEENEPVTAVDPLEESARQLTESYNKIVSYLENPEFKPIAKELKQRLKTIKDQSIIIATEEARDKSVPVDDLLDDKKITGKIKDAITQVLSEYKSNNQGKEDKGQQTPFSKKVQSYLDLLNKDGSDALQVRKATLARLKKSTSSKATSSEKEQEAEDRFAFLFDKDSYLQALVKNFGTNLNAVLEAQKTFLDGEDSIGMLKDKIRRERPGLFHLELDANVYSRFTPTLTELKKSTADLMKTINENDPKELQDLNDDLKRASTAFDRFDVLADYLGLKTAYKAILNEFNVIASDQARKKAGFNRDLLAKKLDQAWKALPRHLYQLQDDAKKVGQAGMSGDDYQDRQKVIYLMNKQCKVYLESLLKKQQLFIASTSGRKYGLIKQLAQTDRYFKDIGMRLKNTKTDGASDLQRNHVLLKSVLEAPGLQSIAPTLESLLQEALDQSLMTQTKEARDRHFPMNDLADEDEVSAVVDRGLEKLESMDASKVADTLRTRAFSAIQQKKDAIVADLMKYSDPNANASGKKKEAEDRYHLLFGDEKIREQFGENRAKTLLETLLGRFTETLKDTIAQQKEDINKADLIKTISSERPGWGGLENNPSADLKPNIKQTRAAIQEDKETYKSPIATRLEDDSKDEVGTEEFEPRGYVNACTRRFKQKLDDIKSFLEKTGKLNPQQAAVYTKSYETLLERIHLRFRSAADLDPETMYKSLSRLLLSPSELKSGDAKKPGVIKNLYTDYYCKNYEVEHINDSVEALIERYDNDDIGVSQQGRSTLTYYLTLKFLKPHGMSSAEYDVIKNQKLVDFIEKPGVDLGVKDRQSIVKQCRVSLLKLIAKRKAENAWQAIDQKDQLFAVSQQKIEHTMREIRDKNTKTLGGNIDENAKAVFASLQNEARLISATLLDSRKQFIADEVKSPSVGLMPRDTLVKKHPVVKKWLEASGLHFSDIFLPHYQSLDVDSASPGSVDVAEMAEERKTPNKKMQKVGKMSTPSSEPTDYPTSKAEYELALEDFEKHYNRMLAMLKMLSGKNSALEKDLVKQLGTQLKALKALQMNADDPSFILKSTGCLSARLVGQAKKHQKTSKTLLKDFRLSEGDVGNIAGLYALKDHRSSVSKSFVNQYLKPIFEKAVERLQNSAENFCEKQHAYTKAKSLEPIADNRVSARVRVTHTPQTIFYNPVWDKFSGITREKDDATQQRVNRRYTR